jgi:hypothetical protein
MSRQTVFYCRCGARLEGSSARLSHRCPAPERGTPAERADPATMALVNGEHEPKPAA